MKKYILPTIFLLLIACIFTGSKKLVKNENPNFISVNINLNSGEATSFTCLFKNSPTMKIYDDGTIKFSGSVLSLKKNLEKEIPIAIGKIEYPYISSTKAKYSPTNIDFSSFCSEAEIKTLTASGKTGFNVKLRQWYDVVFSISKGLDGEFYVTMNSSNSDMIDYLSLDNIQMYCKSFDKQYVDKDLLSLYDKFPKEPSDLSFVYAPDIHYNILDNRHNNMIDKLLSGKSLTGSNLIIASGDSVYNLHYDLGENAVSKEDHIKNINALNTKLNYDFLWCKGNHDDNSLQNTETKNIVYPNELKDLFIKNRQSNSRYTYTYDENNPDSLYYFVDDNVSKIRLVFLNTHENDYSIAKGKIEEATALTGYINESQIKFISNQALNFSSKGYDKKNWHTLFVGHYPLNFKGTTWYGGENTLNGDSLFEVIKAFRNGSSYNIPSTSYDNPYHNLSSFSVDFISQGPMTVIGYFYGHYHTDQHLIKDGINFIASESVTARDYDNTFQRPRTVMTKNEFAFDIVTINKQLKTVKLFRIGSGQNRSFKY